MTSMALLRSLCVFQKFSYVLAISCMISYQTATHINFSNTQRPRHFLQANNYQHRGNTFCLSWKHSERKAMVNNNAEIFKAQTSNQPRDLGFPTISLYTCQQFQSCCYISPRVQESVCIFSPNFSGLFLYLYIYIYHRLLWQNPWHHNPSLKRDLYMIDRTLSLSESL